jgi:SpoVK/Ycf46/Vps4 family AAA+-type ATPase
MIDPVQILEVTLYSKLLNEASSHFLLLEKMNMMYIVFAFFIYKLVTLNYVQDLMYKLKDIIVERYLNSYSSMTVSGHTKSYFSGFGSSKQVTKILYSNKFKAITHYLLKENNEEISNFNEVMKTVHSNYHDEDILEYIMLPEYNQKILLCKKKNIFLEIIVNEKKTLDEEKDNKKKSETDKLYAYKLTIPQRFKYTLLEEFVKMCENVYEDEVNNKKTHMVFEYLSSEKDEDCVSTLKFREYPFKSNKFLDKNIYFEGKEKLIEYVDKFKVKKEGAEITEHEKEYEEVGVTFKASLLLKGPPGCGKSCTIRGILNRTGRHGVIVTWSKLKTCADICSLFRQTKINNKKYTMDQLCFIFEDFDANDCDILKKRSSKLDGSNVLSSGGSVTKLLKKHAINKVDDDIDEECENKSDLLTDMQKLMLLNKSHIEDELTLECVLNVLDGIIELHNVMIIFTTNHLEQIDPAFTRSGRIDFHQEFKLASVNIIKEMLQTIRKIDVANAKYKKYFDKMRDYVISPADVQNICFKYKNENVTEILNDIIALCN